MTTCEICVAYKYPECTIYNSIPPVGFAAKCKKFIAEEREQEQSETCKECPKNVEGYCLRYDHPDYRFNFVKITDSDTCQI